MYSSKLFDCIKTINPKEWKSIRLSIAHQSGESSDVYRLYVYIEQNKLNLDHARHDIQIVSKDLFPKKSKKNVLNIMSSLNQEVIRSMIHAHVDTHPDLLRMIKFEVLNNRGLYHEANKVARQSQRESDQANILDLWKWYYSIRINHLQFFSNNPIQSDRTSGEIVVRNLINSYTRFHSAITKYTSAEILNRQIIYGENWTTELTELERYFTHDTHLLQKAIDMQYAFAKSEFQIEPTALLDILYDDSLEMSSDMLLSIYYRIRRYYIDQFRSGNHAAKDKVIELILWSMKQSVFLEDHRINGNRFKSDVIILTRYATAQLALEYISLNSPYLDRAIRDELIVMSKMLVNFAETQYLEVVKLYTTILFKDPLNKVIATSIFIKACYETNEEVDILLRYIRNAKEVIKRNRKKIAVTAADSYHNFLIATQYLLVNKNKANSFLNSGVSIIDRFWLIEKLSNSNQ